MNARPHTVIENQWIILKDGTRLAARIFLPDDSVTSPVPAVLEFLPYRKRNGTAPRDESTYPVFAAAGIAGVRVDIRGSGESDGVIDGEYTERELSDACEVIAWIAAQDWSNGRVGMMGISWGGFNCLQVAALKPPALKAVISIASTVDRYNDDIHYKNGTHLSAQLSWAATMLAYQSRSPDREIVGDDWRRLWLERLEGEPFFMESWLEHQRRDAFWEHGSICEDFAGFDVPALVIAGWADGYRNTPFKALAGMPDRVHALIGPWIHKYPHFAWPRPRADFHAEAIAWWNHWLRDEPNGAETTPRLRAFIQDGPRPALRREHEPGYWVSKPDWIAPQTLALYPDGAGGLTSRAPADAGTVALRSPLATGTAAGEWFTLKPDAEMAGDQRVDDAGSLTFETAPLDAEMVLLGLPELTVSVASDAPLANLCARLVDVHPDGTATRISFGVLNLAHRGGNAEPQPMVPGRADTIRLLLDACGYRLAPGHRLRLSLSTAYWPMILPPPFDATLTFDLARFELRLPLLGAHERIAIPEPADPDPLPHYEELEPGATRRSVERDLMTGTVHYRIFEDTGLSRHPGNMLASRDVRDEVWSIREDDPLSATGRSEWTCVIARDGWETRTNCVATLACTADSYVIHADMQAYENGVLVFETRFDRTLPRDHM